MLILLIFLVLGEIWFSSLNGVNEVSHTTKIGEVVKLLCIPFMYELLQKFGTLRVEVLGPVVRKPINLIQD